MQDYVDTSLIQAHYRKEAEALGLSGASTMRDQTVRVRETEAIVNATAWYLSQRKERTAVRILELGCGNGTLLTHLRAQFPEVVLEGVDYSPEMVALAEARKIENCKVREGDVRSLAYDDAAFDVVITERCVINLLDEHDQEQAFREIHRVAASGGLYICIEAFTDGLDNLNRAKRELGLEPQAAPYHNRWLDKDRFIELLGVLFEVVSAEERAAAGLAPRNFLSSHYFVSRVLYPAVSRAEIRYNTEFVEFFGFLPPIGNYSPIQLFLLRKPGPGPGGSR